MLRDYHEYRQINDHDYEDVYFTESLNAYGFINNTCKCADFGFHAEPEWSDELNQPYCRCDTRYMIKYKGGLGGTAFFTMESCMNT